jgi:hypothetical protein
MNLFRYGNVVVDRDQIIGFAYERRTMTIWSSADTLDDAGISWHLLAFLPGMSIRLGEYPTEEDAIEAFEDAVSELKARVGDGSLP